MPTVKDRFDEEVATVKVTYGEAAALAVLLKGMRELGFLDGLPEDMANHLTSFIKKMRDELFAE